MTAEKLASTQKAWREWTAEPFDWDKDFAPDWQAAQQHTEETAHDYINALEAELAEAQAELGLLRFIRTHAEEYRFLDEDGDPNWTADEADIVARYAAREEAK